MAHLIYHWKHGWIPLTHAAALSKAHGNAHLADKYVPGASTHHTSLPTHGKSAREIHAGLSPHRRPHSNEAEVAKLRHGHEATVTGMDQYGQTMTFSGRVSGVPTSVRIKNGPSGAPEHHFAVSMHNGSDASGMDATARTTVYVKREDQGAALREHLNTHREMAQQASEHRRRANIAARERIAPSSADLTAAAEKWKRDNPGRKMAGHEAEVDRIARDIAERKFVNTGVRSRNTPQEAAAERERARQTVAGDAAFLARTAQRLAAEKNAAAEADAIEQGRLSLRRASTEGVAELQRRQRSKSGAPATLVGHTHVDPSASHAPGSGASDVAANARATVEHSGDGTTLSIGRNDIEARNAAKAAGFKWSRNLGSWYLPRTWSESTRRNKVAALQRVLGLDAVHVNDVGRGSTLSAAEREAQARERAAARSERMASRAAAASQEADQRFGAAKQISDRIPLGQPILVGHHSESRHRRDLARINNNMRKGFEADSRAKEAAAAASRARAAAAGDSPLARQRRIGRNEAEVRKIDRELQTHDLAVRLHAANPEKAAKVAHVISVQSTDRLNQLNARRTELVDQIQHDRSQITAAGFTAPDTRDLAPGDVIHYRGRAHVVSKVNQKTVSVPTGYSWEDKVPINQITKHTPMSKLSDASLEAAARAAKNNPKLRATLLRELNRRGISAADL